MGPGYESPDIAVASAPSNALKVELTDEDTDLPVLWPTVNTVWHRLIMYSAYMEKQV